MTAKKHEFQVPDDLFGLRLPTDIQEPVTDAEFARGERALGVRLPRDLLAVLRVRNGGQVRLTSLKLPASAARTYGRKTYAFTHLAGMHPSASDAITRLATLARDEWELPDGLVPLGGDGHSWCCLDYRASGPDGPPTVTHVDLEQEIEVPLASSFAAFIAALFRDSESLEPALIALDEGCPMGKRLDAALQAVGCTPYTIPGLASNPRRPPPLIWHWPKYKGILRKSPAWLQFERNKLYDVSIQKTPLRSDRHPMLTVAVATPDEEACLRELLAALGPHAVLIHGVQ